MAPPGGSQKNLELNVRFFWHILYIDVNRASQADKVALFQFMQRSRQGLPMDLQEIAISQYVMCWYTD